MKTPLLIITALESELKQSDLPSDVKIVFTGLGKINALLSTIHAIQTYEPKLIINFGTVGKINPELNGLLSIHKVIQRDMAAEPLAPRGITPFCPRPYEYFSVAGEHVCGTGDSFVTEYDPWLHEQKVDVVDMELFAIASAAFIYNIPWHSFKYISDDANEDSGDQWKETMHHGHDLYMQKLSQFV
jgi:adenosylhomocysteine nucleosidase|tara:strand:- start:4532 stop:5089 length:558 start_codon:yes stop_codon:yes gene_type:complete